MCVWKCAVIVLIVSSFSSGNCDSLSPQQEEEIIKFISYEIMNYDVHDVDSLNKCLEKLTYELKPYMRYGIKAWGVPVLEPMFLKNVKVLQNQGNSQLKAHFRDVLVYGLSNFELKYIRTYPEKYSFDLAMRFPELKMLGHYDIDGKLLILNIKDNGPFTANLTHVDASLTNKFKVMDGILSLHSSNMDFTFKTLKFHLDNLFQGSEIGESVNEALNQGINDLLAELKPNFVKEINKIVKQTLQKGLQNLPLSKWNAAINKT